jgi:acyl-CoA hydrolase
VDVEAERYDSQQTVTVTTATLTMVSVDEQGKAIPFTTPARQ